MPVVHNGRIVGIVNRADLVRALAEEEEAAPAPHESGGFFAEMLAEARHHTQDRTATVKPPAEAEEVPLSVSDFRRLVADHDEELAERRRDQRQELTKRRREHVAGLIDEHISDSNWRALIQHPRCLRNLRARRQHAGAQGDYRGLAILATAVAPSSSPTITCGVQTL